MGQRMNCPRCREDVENPCKTSDDCAGCYRLADKPEPMNRDQTTATMLELLAEQLSAATVTAGDIGIWTANRATLTQGEKVLIASMRHKLTSMMMNVQGIAGSTKDADDE